MQRLASSDDAGYDINAVLWEFVHGVILKFTVEEISQVSIVLISVLSCSVIFFAFYFYHFALRFAY
jgi:hypothetical protein